jgi:hypothetical protein
MQWVNQRIIQSTPAILFLLHVSRDPMDTVDTVGKVRAPNGAV